MACVTCCEATDGELKVVKPVGFDGAVQPVPIPDLDDEQAKALAGKERNLELFASAVRRPREQAGDATPEPAEVSAKPAEEIAKLQDGRAVFVVNVTTPQGKSPGIGCDLSEGSYLRVNKVEPVGPVPMWNATALPEEQVRVGDFIVRVAHTAGDARDMMLALHKSGPVEIVVRRPRNFMVRQLEPKKHGGLGLDLSYHPRSTSLVVKEVLGTGAVAFANQLQPEDDKVQADDHIVAVNGISGVPKDLQSILIATDRVDVEFSRPDMS